MTGQGRGDERTAYGYRCAALSVDARSYTGAGNPNLGRPPGRALVC